MSRAEVISRLGDPELVVERSGDVLRSYLPTSRPEYAWPEACACLYYLSDEMVVVIDGGRVKSCKSISADDREVALDTISRLQISQPTR